MSSEHEVMRWVLYIHEHIPGICEDVYIYIYYHRDSEEARHKTFRSTMARLSTQWLRCPPRKDRKVEVDSPSSCGSNTFTISISLLKRFGT